VIPWSWPAVIAAMKNNDRALAAAGAAAVRGRSPARRPASLKRSASAMRFQRQTVSDRAKPPDGELRQLHCDPLLARGSALSCVASYNAPQWGHLKVSAISEMYSGVRSRLLGLGCHSINSVGASSSCCSGRRAPWPFAANAQQATIPEIGYLSSASLIGDAGFRQGLKLGNVRFCPACAKRTSISTVSTRA
jgi:hypothetical protein